jgi:hypothetical protein
MQRRRHSSTTRTLTRMTELAIAAPQVVATRSARMLAAGATPGKADVAEFSKMWTEKGAAFWESLFAMSMQMAKANQEYARMAAIQWWRLCTTPWWFGALRPTLSFAASLPRIPAFLPMPSPAQRNRSAAKLVDAALGPVHQRATANARRLARTRKR